MSVGFANLIQRLQGQAGRSGAALLGVLHEVKALLRPGCSREADGRSPAGSGVNGALNCSDAQCLPPLSAR